MIKFVLLLPLLFLVAIQSQESFAEIPEFIIQLPGGAQSTESEYIYNSTIVGIDTLALDAEKMNLSIFNETLEITHEQNIIRNATD